MEARDFSREFFTKKPSADIIHELQQVRETLVKKEIIVDSVAAETIDRRILITKEED